ncbi:SGNH/GDSL hydrolase family protein [Paludicola sp. MB14-C6]|uniref:SGNH/GDSL hydrolase family protein n=1 Tax=Paludihabitans sp. MB14-C6 TaxID=3070656 RepID=UPI0027DE125E|nr:SGNH/GDSL hydrolase family protein [Paludicola sp. MB14-C6]WMJ21856.1 SGNH/GDSL hydrolase family protein [Paludicola sp. MB14-C6]
MLKENAVILFQGDSITDAGRTYDASNDLGAGEDPKKAELGLGFGYPLKVKEYLDTFHKDKHITVINRGISGNRTVDLKNRWDEDCIQLKPDFLSILIGINDTWRRYDSNQLTTTEEYEENFRTILKRAKEECHCDIIILEPFLLPTDPSKESWREDLDPKIQVARKLAREFHATYIPLDGVFAANCVNENPVKLSLDGVHPTSAGHSMIAKLWLDIML